MPGSMAWLAVAYVRCVREKHGAVVKSDVSVTVFKLAFQTFSRRRPRWRANPTINGGHQLAKFGFHPRAWIDSLLTYPRFLGTIKPELLQAGRAELGPRLSLHHASWWPKKLDPPFAKRILAISPHPDDESIGCGGLLLTHAASAEIRIINIYNGDGGGALETGPWHEDQDYKERLVSVRGRELDAAAKRFGATSITRLGVSDRGGNPGNKEVAVLGSVLRQFSPDLVVLPWMLDNHPHHRRTNEIFADAAQGLEMMVIGYEIWSLLTPNAFLDITDVLDRKLELVGLYESQLRTIDYVGYARGLAHARAFHYPVRDKRTGAVEAFIALPSRDYCDLVKGRANSGARSAQ